MKLTTRNPWQAAGAAICLLALGACATQPQPCTAEWIDWKTDKVLNRFARANYDTVRDLRQISGKVENPSALTAMRIALLLDNFNDLARDFDRIVMPELNQALAQCSEPALFIPAFSSFLRDEGVGEDVIQWVEVISYVAIQQRGS